MTWHIFSGWRQPRVIATTLAFGAMAACGGGGGGDPVEDPGPQASAVDVPPTASGLRGATDDLLDTWVPNGQPNYTTLATVPSTGSASFNGFVFGDLSDQSEADSLIGRLALTARFSADSTTFTGSATDFVDQDDAPLSGSLIASGGTLNRGGNPASDATLRGISLDGDLRASDGTTFEMGLTLEGDFLGATANAIGGEALGRVDVGSQTIDFDGGFIVAE